jgi:hypothetical protein
VLEEGRLTGEERCRHGHASGGGREAVLARCAGAGAAKQY